MVKQKLTVTLTSDGDELNVSLSFDPGIAGDKSDELAQMGETETLLQNYIQHIGVAVMEAVN